MKTTKRHLAKILRVTGDETRLAILCMLFTETNICVSEIAHALNSNVAIVSHHLRTMAKAGLLTPIRTGKKICYRIRPSPMSTDLKRLICNQTNT